MNFLQLCQKVLDEGDRAPHEIETTTLDAEADEQTYKVVGFVKDAYADIQRWSRYFRFLHSSGVLFETLADGTQDYSVANIRKVYRDSLWIRVKATPTEKWELTYLTYKQWRDMFQINDLAEGSPIYFVELPSGQYRLEPGPSRVFEVMADWTIRLDKLEQDEDVPLWDEDHHELIVYQALQYYMSEYEVPEELRTRIAARFPTMKGQFLLEYLPDMEIVGGFA